MRIDNKKQENNLGGHRILVILNLSIIYILCLLYSFNSLDSNSDYWAHAAIGHWICSHHQIPKHTLFLWTSSQPWIAHSWMSEIFIYGLLKTLGPNIGPTLSLMMIATIGWIALFHLWKLYKVVTLTLYPITNLFFAAVVTLGPRLQARPEIFSIVLLATLLSILVSFDLHIYKDKLDNIILTGKLRILRLLLMLMFIVWPNLHGGMIWGLIILWIYSIANALQDRLSKISINLLLTSVICTLLTFINPYGIHYYSIYNAIQTLTFSHITEWRPILGEPFYGIFELLCVCLLVGFAIYSWYKSHMTRWAHILWLFVFVILSFSARRNVAGLDLVCLAIAAPYFSYKKNNDVNRTKPVFNKIWASLCLIFLITIGILTYSNMGRWPLSATSPIMADNVSSMIVNYHITGRLFNDYDYGSYLEWRLFGLSELYIDGMNAYSDSVFLDYIDILRATPRGQLLIDQQNIECVIGRCHMPNEPDIPMLYVYVAKSPQWALIYYGPDGPIWIRRYPKYKQLWDGVPTYNGNTPDDFIQYLHQSAKYGVSSDH